MIYLEDKNLTIVTPYKCGSSSLHKMLCKERYGGVYICGPQPGGEIDKHTFCLPWFSRNGKTVIVVRDPYRRASSLYTQHLRYFQPLSFDEYIDTELMTNEINEPVFASLEKSGIAAVDYWQLEHIQDCLAGVGIMERLPVENRGTSRVLTASQIERINPWAKPDCERFGYPFVG